MVWKSNTNNFPLSFQSLKGSSRISGVILYLDFLDEQNKYVAWPLLPDTLG
jgi:hypothetical protein